MEEVPAPDEHAPTLLRCASCLPIRRRSRRGTTTSSPRRSLAPVPTSSLRRRSFRFGETPGRRRLPPQRAVLPALVAALQALAPATAAEGGRAPRRDALARVAARPDVVHLQWLALPQADVHLRFRSPAVFTAHDLLPRRTASRTRPLAAAARSLRPRRRAHRARPRDAGRARRRRARDPAPRLPERGDPRRTTGATLLSLGVIRPYKGLAGRDRGDAAPAGCAPARRRRPGDAARRAARRRAGRVAARLPLASGARPRALGGDGRRLSRTAPSSTSRARCCRRSAPACPPSSTTSAASASRSAPSVPGGSCRPATSMRSPRLCSELLSDAEALARARAGAERARARADLGRGGRAAPRPVPGARLIFRRARSRR